MNRDRICRSGVVSAVMVMLLVLATRAEAFVAYAFPPFGVLNGAQIVRLNVVLNSPDGDSPCPVSLAFIDSQGAMIGQSTDVELLGGAAVHKDLASIPGVGLLARSQVRARITYGEPDNFPGCRAGVLASVEVFDKITGITRAILTNPARVGVQGSVDFDIMFMHPATGATIACDQALVESVRSDFFDELGVLRTGVVRPCVLGERYLVTLDAGRYTLRVHGLQGLNVCYEATRNINIHGGETQTTSVTASQNANPSCTYPSPPPPPR